MKVDSDPEVRIVVAIDTLIVAQRQIPMVRFPVILHLQYIDKVVDVPMGRFSSSTGAVCEKNLRSYSCSTWRS